MIHGGKSYVSSPPAFSNDAKKLLICTGNTVSVFSTSTGMRITELEGHQALITSVAVLPSNSKALCCCWTSSLDGTIRFWDFATSELLKTVDIKLPIYSMVIPSLARKKDESDGNPADAFAYISIEDIYDPQKAPKSLRGQILKYNLTKSHLAGGIKLAETLEPAFITMSPSGEFFGILNKRTLLIWKVPDKDSDRALVKKMKLHHTKDMSTVAFHPRERIVAAGDVTGRILVWRGLGYNTFSHGTELTAGRLRKDKEERPGVRGDDDADLCSTWHWHSTEVTVLSFSSDGAYLYSGGHEGVLVLWQLETGNKKFLPRIGSALLYFVASPDPLLSSISCADNQIHLLKMPRLEIMKSIAGIKLPCPCPCPDLWNGSSAGVAVDEKAALVALRTENYRIQFYSLFDNCEVSEVQVCERNHQPGDDITVVVTLISISPDGSLMSTAETRLPEEGIGGLVCLRFWACESQKKNFMLSTIVYEPHRDAAISGIAFHPRQHMAASSSYGGDFKIWVQSPAIQERGQTVNNSGWTCHAVGSYKKRPMTAVAFSGDGSVLAVAAEMTITLWDPDRNYLVAVVGETLEPIASLTFVGQSEYLVSAVQGPRPQLSMWSMSKLSERWSYKFCAEAVACAKDASVFAVLVLLPRSPEDDATAPQLGDGVILLFDIEGPIPIATWSAKKAQGGGLAFLRAEPSSLGNDKKSQKQASPLLAYINSDHEYVVFDPCSKDTQECSLVRKENKAQFEETDQVGYAALYGELPDFDPKKGTEHTSILPSERHWETIFGGSSHNLPPLTKLCAAFLESFLEKRPLVVD